MSNVVYPPFVTSIDVPVERVLNKAIEADLKNVFVMGYTKDGDEYFASSAADGGTVLWVMERVKHKLMEVSDDE